jgi:hypothetical protein
MRQGDEVVYTGVGVTAAIMPAVAPPPFSVIVPTGTVGQVVDLTSRSALVMFQTGAVWISVDELKPFEPPPPPPPILPEE